MAVPDRFSIYRFCSAIRDAKGALYLTDAPPARFVDLPDNRRHTAVLGDTWADLAARHYGAFPDPELLWPVIADFQPEPVEDPTLALEPGKVIFIPSPRTVTELIFSESRRPEYEG